MLNERLNKFSDDFFILSENQTGFRKGYSTIDNLFIVHSFFEILKKKKKKNVLLFYRFRGFKVFYNRRYFLNFRRDLKN
jgi:hypothetical protein